MEDAALKKKGEELLGREDLRQKMRRELLFGLLPKTFLSINLHREHLLNDI